LGGNFKISSEVAEANADEILVVELELSDGTELDVARDDPDTDEETGLFRDELEPAEFVVAMGPETLLDWVLLFGRGTAIVTDCDCCSWPFELAGDGT
jgi:hypothetical protein